MNEIYNTIACLIEDELGDNGKAYTMGKFTGRGWLFPEGEHTVPAISLKQYEKTVNLYILPTDSGASVLERYQPIFKKSNIGKGCLRVRRLDEAKIEAIRELVQLVKSS